MKIISINGTAKTPTIIFDPGKGTLEVSGRCIPEDPIAFFRPLTEALSTYLPTSPPTIEVIINLEYFNTSSSRCIYNMLKKIQTVTSSATKVQVNWLYEDGDDEAMEIGDDFSKILELPFKLIPQQK